MKSRSLATRRIIDEHKQVGYLYREEPMEGEANGYPDSGWRFMEGDEKDDYVDDPANLQFVSLGLLLNIDDSFLHLLSEPIGSAFIRVSATGEFERLAPSEDIENMDSQQLIDTLHKSQKKSPWWKFWE